MNTSMTRIISRKRQGALGQGLIGRAFTLIELLVVVIIMLILLVIAVPAFSSILATQDELTAHAQFSAGVSAARDAALQSTGDADVAAVFTFEPGGRTTMVMCERIGKFDQDQNAAGLTVSREVFVPVEGIEPLQLPAGWMVRGYAGAASVDADWYEVGTGGANARYPSGTGSWVFPETGFFDHTKQNQGADRQSFMIRFEAGTGILRPSGGSPVLVVLQRPSSDDRANLASWQRIDRATSIKRWAQRVLSDTLLTPANRMDLIGDRSGDTVLVRPVSQLALYQERKLADALSNPAIGGSTAPVRLDPNTGCLYAATPDDAQNGRRFSPAYVAPLATDPLVATKINRWIEGYRVINLTTGGGVRADTPSAKVFIVPKNAGAPLAVSVPTPLSTGAAL